MEYIMDEYDIRNIHPPRKRLDKITEILKNEKDESKRWDCVWLAGEMTEAVPKHEHAFHNEIADLMVWILRNDDNGIVKHEAAFQIGLRNFRDKIPDLIHCALNDKSDVARHEAIEALGLMRVHECKPQLEEMTKSDITAVKETAIFVLKRLERLKDKGAYKGEAIL